MTCDKLPPVGDRGQRYEVRYAQAETGAVKVMGWTNDPTGGALLRSANKWPEARRAWVVDRQPTEGG